METTVRYHCTHCGRRFDGAPKDIVECPSCFWTSSVRREEPGGESPAAAPEVEKGTEDRPARLPSPLKGRLAIVLVIVFAVILAALAVAAGMKWLTKPRAEPAPSIVVPGGKVADRGEDDVVLKRELSLAADRPFSKIEEEILARRVDFKTGLVEKIPSQPLSLEHFEKMIQEQEESYKIRFSKKYKGQLKALFREKYEEAQKAFLAGDLVGARNLWAESLAFPVYRDNPARHRGVALTILRPLINDTLSKIGALNVTLAEKGIREKERELTELYGRLAGALDRGALSEALPLISESEKKAAALSSDSQAGVLSPPYSVGISKVDDGIRATLVDIQTVPEPALADLDPLLRDLEEKKKVVQGFLPQFLEKQMTLYRQALQAIREGRREEARGLLGQIEFPPALVADAKEKAEHLGEAPPPKP